MNLGQYGEIAVNIAVAVAAYYFLHWIGFALWAFFVLCNYGYQITNYQKTMMNTLLSRLPDRCAMCHREIVDEGGIIDDDGEGIYHEKCMDKLETIRAKYPDSKGVIPSANLRTADAWYGNCGEIAIALIERNREN